MFYQDGATLANLDAATLADLAAALLSGRVSAVDQKFRATAGDSCDRNRLLRKEDRGAPAQCHRQDNAGLGDAVTTDASLPLSHEPRHDFILAPALCAAGAVHLRLTNPCASLSGVLVGNGPPIKCVMYADDTVLVPFGPEELAVADHIVSIFEMVARASGGLRDNGDRQMFPLPLFRAASVDRTGPRARVPAAAYNEPQLGGGGPRPTRRLS
ncbi:MAG: hypothetical protein M1826_005211 [Phylliscum demangeonii]|nr:MAG: hypothetical protein M1826_005211 [Phylliscum demangeonii]